MKSTSNFPDLSSPAVMGILNLTPDSFYDGGRNTDEKDSLARAEEMINAGARIIDIGGASSRPGAQQVSAEDEWARIESILQNIRKTFGDICISVDTFHAIVARKALDQGADMINDISGGTFDPDMATLIGERDIPFVIMHMQGQPGNMQLNPKYEDVVEDVASFFKKQINTFIATGASKLILDPGFGFGKTLEHNYSLLHHLDHFVSFGYPVLAGVSRKSMINKVIDSSPAEALNGTTVLNTIALMKGANILRVHDVKEAVEAVKLVEKLGE